MIDVNKMNPDKKKVDLSNLIKYAKQRNILKKVRGRIGVWL